MDEKSGTIYGIARSLKIPERRITDFSEPVNPLGVSKKVKAELRKQLKYLDTYPDADCTRLKKYLSRHTGAGVDRIVCGNGCTELIYLIVKALNPEKALIPAPTAPVYEKALTACRLPTVADGKAEGARRSDRHLLLREDKDFGMEPDAFIEAMEGCAAAFLCNPNNPTGRVLKRDEVIAIAQEAEAKKCWLVVDESFIDFAPGETIIDAVADYRYSIVLRSMSTYYALAGLRIGYGVFPEGVAALIRERREPLPVNSLAQRAAVTAMRDRAYGKETGRIIGEEKRFLENRFRKLGVKYYPSDANYYLVRVPHAERLCRFLLKRFIVVRTCDDIRGLDGAFLRIAVGNHRENSMLVKAIEEFRSRENAA